MKILIYLCLVFPVVFVSSCQEDDESTNLPQEQVSGEFIDANTYRVFPRSSDNFNIAEFRLWLPESDDPVRAVVVLLGSHNFNGLGLTTLKDWQAFAREEQTAILGVHFKTLNQNTGYYSEAQMGSGRALLLALEALSQDSGNDYILELPFLFRGYSAGGLFSHSFSSFMPDRVLAFANIRGGGLNLTPDNNLGIPGIMFYGELDFQQRNDRIKEVVELKRGAGGNWCLIREPDTDHYGELDGPDRLIRMLFSKVMEKRLSDNDDKLLEIQESEGWLGSHLNYEVYPFDDFPGDNSKSSWLIDEEFSRRWQEMQQNNN